MTRDLIDKRELLRRIDIIDLCVDLGLLSDSQIKNGNMMISCYNKKSHVNGDKNKSAKIYSDSNIIHCFGCGKHANAVDLVSDIFNYTEEEALIYLGKKYNLKVSLQKQNSNNMWKQKELKLANTIFGE